MKNQIGLIEHYSKELTKVIASHGADSEYTTYAFFVLQGVKMGKPLSAVFDWARSETDRLHQLTLDMVEPMFVADDADLKFFENKRGYLLCTALPVDVTKLEGVKVLGNRQEAEDMLRASNVSDGENIPNIPSIVSENGEVLGESLNGCFFKIDITIEEYINTYDI